MVRRPPGYFFSVTPLPFPLGKRSSWNMPSLPPSHTPHSHPYIFLFSLFGAGFLSPVTKTQMTPTVRFHHLRLGPPHGWCSLLLTLPRSVTLLSSHQRLRPRSQLLSCSDSLSNSPLITGGNGSMDPCSQLSQMGAPRGQRRGLHFFFCPQISRMGSEL